MARVARRTSKLAKSMEEDPTEDLPDIIVSEEWRRQGPPVRGAGWWGKGAPIQVQAGYKIRAMEDGLGICSPGRWAPEKRNLPDLGDFSSKFLEAISINKEEWVNVVLKMLVGKTEAMPFTKEQIEKGKQFIRGWLAQVGCPEKRGKRDRPQDQEIRMLQALLKACADPDAPALDSYAVGVRLGHSMRMPRTPAVFEQKTRWRLDYETEEEQTLEWAKKYRTAREKQELLEEKIEKVVQPGRLRRMSMKGAKSKYGDRLRVGALGLVEEGADKFRLIHDGTRKVGVNLRIRARDHIPSPLVSDISAEMAEVKDRRLPHIALVWDFESAHRIVQVAEEDWGLQACTPATCSTDT